MKKIMFVICIFSISITHAFSLKDKIINGSPGDYVVTEQGGTSSVIILRSLTQTHLILEEIDIPSLHRKSSGVSWKQWIQEDAPGHTAWITYIIDLKTNQLQECYSHSQGVWLPTKDASHFLPKLLSLSLQKTPQEHRKRIGPPPAADEEDRRSVWNPSVIVEGQKLDKAMVTAWSTRWPGDGSLISDCEIDLYFSTQAFPVWIEVKSPHYKACLRAVDSGHHMSSPRPLIFQESPLILGPGVWKKDHIELVVHCPTYYTALKLYVVDLTDSQHPFIELTESSCIETPEMVLQVQEKILDQNLLKGHHYRWVLIPVAYPSVVIYSNQDFQW